MKGLPPGDENRSALALSHDPPARKAEWRLEAATTGPDLLASVRGRLGLDTVTWDRVLRHAGVHVDGHRLEPDRPPRMVAEGARVTAYWFEREPERLVLPEDVVLLDRGGVVAVNKPAWYTVQGSRASRLTSLELALRERLSCPELAPCHRLDRETTGVLLFARTSSAARLVGRQFQRREVRKGYLAVVTPPPAREGWTVEGYLVRVPHRAHSSYDLATAPEDGARFSRTRFRLLESLEDRALVEARPETGRTHQLRVHLAASGTPILGDSLYGTGGGPGGASRLQLHAVWIELALHADRGDTTRVEAPAPDDFGLAAS